MGLDTFSRSVRDVQLLELLRWSDDRSRGNLWSPVVHADLTVEKPGRCGKKRVASLMRNAGMRGVYHQRKRRGWKPLPAPHDDLVKLQFTAHAPDRVWFCGITPHRTRVEWVYCAAVIHTYSRLVDGWSIRYNLRSELVVNVLEMAKWQRKPALGTIVQSDREVQ